MLLWVDPPLPKQTINAQERPLAPEGAFELPSFLNAQAIERHPYVSEEKLYDCQVVTIIP